MTTTVDEQLGFTRRTAWLLNERVKAMQNDLEARLVDDPAYCDDMQAIAEDRAKVRGLRMREAELLLMPGNQELMDFEGEVAE